MPKRTRRRETQAKAARAIIRASYRAMDDLWPGWEDDEPPPSYESAMQLLQAQIVLLDQIVLRMVAEDGLDRERQSVAYETVRNNLGFVLEFLRR